MSFKPIIFILSAVSFLLFSCSKKSPDHSSFEAADSLISAAMDDSLFAGAVLLAGSSNGILHHNAFGYATRYDSTLAEIPRPEIMTPDHIFDLASLTKVLATTYGLMVLHSRDLFDINDPVSAYLPEFSSPEKEAITIGQLLRHRSGLIPWHPAYYVAETPEERLAFIASHPLNSPPGEERRYSDFGFMVLGDIIEKISGMPLEQFLMKEIYGPLGLSSTTYNPDSRHFEYLVSTSHGNPFEKKMVHENEFGYRIDIDPETWDGWRTHTLRGEVNDGNAFYAQQGIAGHAGLFSTAKEIHMLLSVLLNDGFVNGTQLIKPETVELFLTPDSDGQALGWLMNPGYIHGKNLPEGSFGHTGFTGTHIIASPKTDRILVLLTNRQHIGPDESGNYPNLRPLREELSSLLLNTE